MRILYLVTKADLGGAQVHILDLLRGFRNLLDPVVAVGEAGYFTEAVRRLGVRCHVVPNLIHQIHPVKDCKAVVDVAALIHTVQPDVVHAHTSKAGVIGRLAARATGVPSVFTAHTWCFAEGASWKWRLAGVPAERLAGMYSSAIVNVSEANRTLALRHGISSPERQLTIWNGIPDSSHRARPGSAGPPAIIMVGRLVEQKDHSLLLRAFAGVPSAAKLQFAGDGPLRPALESEASQLGLSGRVEFLGERLDVSELLAQGQIFALATKWEGFPLSILEAMRAGLPVIASNVGGVPEAVVDSQTGYLVESGNLSQFRDRLRLLAEDPALRQKLGDAGRKRYQANFTLEPMLQKLLRVYQMAVLGIRAPHTFMLPASHLPNPRVGFDVGRG